MHHPWLDDLLALTHAGQAVIMISVVKSEGSVPRETGARLLVTADSVLHTIGGGHLEWRAIETAREWLQPGQNTRRMLARYSLGASLGQCCGGTVTLAFERIQTEDLHWIEQMAAGIRARQNMRRKLLFPALKSQQQPQDFSVQTDAEGKAGNHSTCVLHARDDGLVMMEEIIRTNAFHLVLFGAGHVGRALVKALAPLPCTISWVDERSGEFPKELPPNVVADINEDPESAVDAAPAGSYFLVMTHSHALDQTLSERILRRGDFTYFGTIGSRTKRAKFEHRLLARGITEAQLQTMTCPIGVGGIKGKEPAIIAIAVAAELLQVYSKNL